MNSVLIALIIALVAYLIGSLFICHRDRQANETRRSAQLWLGQSWCHECIAAAIKRPPPSPSLRPSKGWLAVFVTMQLVAHYNLSPWLITVAAIAVFLGHVYSLMLGFKGGKGVATGVGILLARSTARFDLV